MKVKLWRLRVKTGLTKTYGFIYQIQLETVYFRLNAPASPLEANGLFFLKNKKSHIYTNPHNIG